MRKVGLSIKSVGAGIGNKGLGFRSIETLTDDVRIYSQSKSRSAEAFDGFCFRFAHRNEIERSAAQMTSQENAAKVAKDLPRYLAATPITEQSANITAFARTGLERKSVVKRKRGY